MNYLTTGLYAILIFVIFGVSLGLSATLFVNIIMFITELFDDIKDVISYRNVKFITINYYFKEYTVKFIFGIVGLLSLAYWLGWMVRHW
jgi:hypothetical protein